VQGLLSAIVPRPKVRAALDKGFPALTTASPRHPLLGLTYAGFLAETGRTEEAWKVFHQAEVDGLCDLALGSRHAFALNLASRAPEPAEPAAVVGSDLETLKAAVAANPNHTGLRLRLARRIEASAVKPPAEDPASKAIAEAALAEYQKACELNPAAWTAHFRAAEILLELGRAKDSLPFFAKAVQLFPAYAPWRLAEAEAKAAAGDTAGSAASFAGYAERFESDLFVRRLFERLEKRGPVDWAAYVKAVQAVAAKAPSSPYPPSNLAYLHLRAGQTAEARQAALKAEALGLVGRGGVHAHPALREAFGLPLAPESAPTTNDDSKK
jgi:tetratricopeptide (TPR) repeat protein